MFALPGMKAGTDYISEYRFKNCIRPLAGRLSDVIDEIDFSSRLSGTNHHPLFPKLFTVIVDTVRVGHGVNMLQQTTLRTSSATPPMLVNHHISTAHTATLSTPNYLL